MAMAHKMVPPAAFSERAPAVALRFSPPVFAISAMSLDVSFASQHSMLFVGTSLLLGHLCFTQSDLSAVFRRCFQPGDRPCTMTFDQQQRYEEDMLKTRLEMITLHNKIAIHFALIFVCSACWMLMQQQDLASVCVFVASVPMPSMPSHLRIGRRNHPLADQQDLQMLDRSIAFKKVTWETFRIHETQRFDEDLMIISSYFIEIQGLFQRFSTLEAHVNWLILVICIPHVFLTLSALKETDLVRLAAADAGTIHSAFPVFVSGLSEKVGQTPKTQWIGTSFSIFLLRAVDKIGYVGMSHMIPHFQTHPCVFLHSKAGRVYGSSEIPP